MNNLVRQVPQKQDQQYIQIDSRWEQPEALQSYDPYWSNQPYSQQPQYIMVDPNQAPPQTALSPMAMLGRSMQNIFQVQMGMLRDLDARMSRLEQPRLQQQPRQQQVNLGEFYTQTWWALWGILMLILGSALVVVLMLILRS